MSETNKPRALNIRDVPDEIMVEVGVAARRSGQTIKAWVLAAIADKLRGESMLN